MYPGCSPTAMPTTPERGAASSSARSSKRLAIPFLRYLEVGPAQLCDGPVVKAVHISESSPTRIPIEVQPCMRRLPSLFAVKEHVHAYETRRAKSREMCRTAIPASCRYRRKPLHATVQSRSRTPARRGPPQGGLHPMQQDKCVLAVYGRNKQKPDRKETNLRNV